MWLGLAYTPWQVWDILHIYPRVYIWQVWDILENYIFHVAMPFLTDFFTADVPLLALTLGLTLTLTHTLTSP